MDTLNSATARPPTIQANLDLARAMITDCFDPAKPVDFGRYCADERSRVVFGAFAAAFPDARFEVEWMVADEGRVVIRGHLRATHGGTWRGVAPTGREIDVAAVTAITVLRDRVIDLSVVSDSLSIAEQIGAVEPFAPKACRVFSPE